MANYEFIDNTKSVTIKINDQSVTVAKNIFDLTIVNETDDKILVVKSSDYKYKDYKINIDDDVVTE